MARASAPTERAGGRDTAWLLALSGILFLWYAAPFVVHGFGFPLGPDGPVYLWWSRLAGYDGLSAVARPGVPAVALTLAGSLHLPLTAVTAGLEISLGVSLGLASWALARAAGADDWIAFAGGLLAGTFGVHLASGYLATLAFAVAFIAAVALLARQATRSTVAATAMLVAAALCHPLFGPLGATILVGATLLSIRDAREEALRIGAAVVGAAVVAAGALAALTIGPDPLSVVTSRDGYLRRASGLDHVLRQAYLDRFVHRWTRYVQWVSVPLVAVGWRRPSGLVARVLWSWAAVTAVGVGVALTTRTIPPDRFITFGFAIPILAAFGLEGVWVFAGRWRRPIRVAIPALLVSLMLAGAWIAWARQEPFLGEREVREIALADAAAASTPPGTLLYLVVDEPDENVSFLAARASNVIRAVVDPARIRDVIIVVPRTVDPPPERGAVEEQTNADLRRANHAGTPTVGFQVSSFLPRRPLVNIGPWEVIGPDVATTADLVGAVSPSGAALEGSEPLTVTLAGVLALALFTVVGYGWTRATSDLTRAGALALSPALGFAVVVLVAIALERVGVPLTGSVGPTVVALVSALGGFALGRVLDRGAGSDATPEIEQEPAE